MNLQKINRKYWELFPVICKLNDNDCWNDESFVQFWCVTYDVNFKEFVEIFELDFCEKVKIDTKEIDDAIKEKEDDIMDLQSQICGIEDDINQLEKDKASKLGIIQKYASQTTIFNILLLK